MNPVFFRVISHLLPDAEAWRVVVEKKLRQFFMGIAEGAAAPVKSFADQVYLESSATDCSLDALREWEREYGLIPNADEELRRLNLAAAKAAGGDQDPDYIQGVLQTAGFDVYVHEWWESGPPWVARDPRDYTEPPTIGTVQCDADEDTQPQCTAAEDAAGNPQTQPSCDAFLANDPHYFDNKTLSPNAPPPIPSDPKYWPYFIYIGGETFPDFVSIDSFRKEEFETLILKLRPLRHWIVTLTYGPLSTEEGEPLLTEDGDELFV